MGFRARLSRRRPNIVQGFVKSWRITWQAKRSERSIKLSPTAISQALGLTLIPKVTPLAARKQPSGRRGDGTVHESHRGHARTSSQFLFFLLMYSTFAFEENNFDCYPKNGSSCSRQ